MKKRSCNFSTVGFILQTIITMGTIFQSIPMSMLSIFIIDWDKNTGRYDHKNEEKKKKKSNIMIKAWLLSTSHAFTRECPIGLEFMGFEIIISWKAVPMLSTIPCRMLIDLLWSEHKRTHIFNNPCWVLYRFYSLFFLFLHVSSLFSLRLAHFCYGFLCFLFWADLGHVVETICIIGHHFRIFCFGQH